MSHNRSPLCSVVFWVAFLFIAVSTVLGQAPTFAPAVAYSSGGQNASSVAVGDVNGDGKPDLVVANQCVSSNNCNGTIGVLLGNGDGTFQAAVSYPSGGLHAYSLAVGDVNGDGKPDLLAANQCASSDCTGGNVGVLLGNGDGTFQPAMSYASGGLYAFSVKVGDVNGDGKPDLLVANYCTSNGSINCTSGNTSGSVGVLLGNGDGTFQAVVIYASGGQYAKSVAVGDVNGDGAPDLVVANVCAALNGNGQCTGDAALGVLLGNGDGTFQPAVAYDSGGVGGFDSPATSILISDIDGDGHPDLVAVNECATSNCLNGSVGVLLGNGDGTFQLAIDKGSAGFVATSAAVGDLNGDGKPDVVVSSLCTLQTQLCGNGSGVGVVAVLIQGYLGKPTTTTFKASPEVVIVGESVNLVLEADVKPTNTTPSPTGSVEFEFPHTGSCIGGFTCIGSAQLVNGRAILDLQYIFVANAQCLVAVYSGDANFAPSTSPEICPTFRQATTKTVVVASQNPVVVGNSAVLTATVNPEFGGAPTGTVKFTQNGFTLGIATLSAGQASITSTFPVAGTHLIIATYSGDSNFKGSTGTLKQVVSLNPSTTVVTASPNPSTHGQAVQLSATVSSAASGGATGTVTFKNGTTILGTATLSAGTATLSTTKLPVGTLTITANYNGDKQSAKSSGTTSQTVN